jgi:hypothetical protein
MELNKYHRQYLISQLIITGEELRILIEKIFSQKEAETEEYDAELEITQFLIDLKIEAIKKALINNEVDFYDSE